MNLHRRRRTNPSFFLLVVLILNSHDVTCWSRKAQPPIANPLNRTRGVLGLFRRAVPTHETVESDRSALLDSLAENHATAPVIFQWKPNRFRILGRYRGTVLETAIRPTLVFTSLSIVACLVAKRIGLLPGIGMQFHESRMRVALSRFDNVWHMHLTVLSFFLAFYLNAAKTTYDKTFSAARAIQGRLNDMNLIAASHARRDANGRMEDDAKQVVDSVSRYTRLFVVLYYSSIARRYKSLLDPEGLVGMKERGMVTEEEMQFLETLPVKARYNAALQWLGSTFARGCETSPQPLMRMEANAHFAFLIKLQDLRSTAATLTDILAAPCPLAYVHLVQLLVDTFLFVTPFAAIADMGWFSIPATFMLSFFFTGLMDLSKQLLDPLNNHLDFGNSDKINVDCLIQESNNGSQRFALTAAGLPHHARQA